MNALAIVSAINTVLSLLTELNISWKELGRAVDVAKSQGRAFDLTDLEPFAERAAASGRSLRDAIAAARKPVEIKLTVTEEGELVGTVRDPDAAGE